MRRTSLHRHNGMPIMVYEPLSKARQLELARKIRAAPRDEDGKLCLLEDIEARNTLILSCYPLVLKMAAKYRDRVQDSDFLDLIQEGMGGLIYAVDIYDPGKHDTTLTTHAWWWIWNRLRLWFEVQYRQKLDGHEQQFSDEAAMGRVAVDVELPNLDSSIIAHRVRDAVDSLGPRAAHVARERLMHGRTLNEVGTDLGVSKERTRQLQRTIEQDLRRKLEGVAG